MILQVPETNSTRFEFSENGPVNVPEMGSVSTEPGLRDLLITDSYLRVDDGTRYPAVLITAGLNDPRVPVWQPAKMAARLQAATASGRPVLLRVDPHAGHGPGSTQTQRNELTADILAFLMHELTPHPQPALQHDLSRRQPGPRERATHAKQLQTATPGREYAPPESASLPVVIVSPFDHFQSFIVIVTVVPL